jgi:integrase
MARSARSAQLETRSSRLRLPVARKPIFVRVGPKIGLGYRRNQTAGTWVARVADGRGGNWTRAIGTADDLDDADGIAILDFWQAQEKARILGRGGAATAQTSRTVGQALDAYEADLSTRGGDINNVKRVRTHVGDGLLDKAVKLLTPRELRNWRDDFVKSVKPATVNRTCAAFKAALNLVADHDENIVSRRAWEIGLAAILGAAQARNVILPEPVVRSIIGEAYRQNTEFGLLVEVAAVTGARVSQLARIEVQELQADREDPRLIVPASRKGRRTKVVTRQAVPITAGLAARLRAFVAGRPLSSPLLVKRSGTPWRLTDHNAPFQRAAKAAGQDPKIVTIYALRHSNIVRQILAGVPIRVVAVNHDTSVTMIEHSYSRYIGDHSDALTRSALLDTTEPAGANVVRLGNDS